MKLGEHKAFATTLAMTLSVYGQECTPLLLDAWWTALEPYTLDGIRAAFAYHVGDYTGYGHRAPTPADIRRHLEVTLVEMRQARAAAVIADAMERTAPYRDQIGRAQSDINLLGSGKMDVSRDDCMARAAAAQEAIDAIMKEPAVVAARRPLSFRDRDLPETRMPAPVERAIAIIGGKAG